MQSGRKKSPEEGDKMEAFAKMPTWVFGANMSAYSKLIYCFLLNGANIKQSNMLSIPITEIAKRNSVSLPTARKSIQELEDRGLIQVERLKKNAAPTFILEDANKDGFFDSDCSFSNRKDIASKDFSDKDFSNSWKDSFQRDSKEFSNSWKDSFQRDSKDLSSGIPNNKRNIKNNNKRSSKRTHAQRVYAIERPSYDTNLFRKKDSFLEDRGELKRG